MKLLIAVPTYGNVPVEFMESLIGLMDRLRQIDVDYELKIKNWTMVYKARDFLAQYAMDNDFTNVLWFDSDMVFAPDVFERLCEYDAPFIVASYAARQYPFSLVAFKDISMVGYPRAKLGETCVVDACGFGCVLMDTEVLRAVSKRFNSCFQPNGSMGEDVAFCNKADSVGYKVLHVPVSVGHIGHIAIYPENAEALRDAVNAGREEE